MISCSLAARMKAYRLALARRWAIFFTGRFDPYPRPPGGRDLSPSHAHLNAYEEAPLLLSWNRAGIADAVEWQNKARDKLTELLGYERTQTPPLVVESRDVHIPGGIKGYCYYLVAGSVSIPVTVILPAARNAPLPVMLCLHGHNSGAHLSWAEERMPDDPNKLVVGADYALQAMRQGYGAVCIEQSCFGERREQLLPRCAAHPCSAAVRHALLLGHTLLGERVSDVSTVIDWLQAEGNGLGLDPTHIHVMGNSAGGETGLYAAALDLRIGGVIASGCIGAYRKTIGKRGGCADAVIPGILKWLENDDILRLCAPRPLLAVSGVRDHLYPFSGVAETVVSAKDIYGILGAVEMLRAVSGPDGHRFYPDQTWPVFLEMTQAANYTFGGPHTHL